MHRPTCLAVVCIVAALAAPARASIADFFTDLYIFGDSLSDSADSRRAPGSNLRDGPSNTLQTTEGVFGAAFGFPPTPYFNGRFSNGPVWSDALIAKFEAAGKIGVNFSFGGAQAVQEIDLPIDIPDFADQRLQFQFDPTITPGSNALGIVGFGGNDLLAATSATSNLIDPGTGQPLPEAQILANVTQDAIAAADEIRTQIDHFDIATLGSVAVLNLGDVGATPRYANKFLPNGDPNPLFAVRGVASAATAAFNARLAENAGLLRASGREIFLVDIATPLAALLADPLGNGFIDATTPCGVPIGSNPVTGLPIVDFGAPDGFGLEAGISPTGCVTEPFSALAGVPANDDLYGWTDDVHPQTRVHDLIAAEISGTIAAAIPLPAPLALMTGALVLLAGCARARRSA